MSLYALEIYKALTNEAAATEIAGSPLSPRLRIFMIDRARNLATWTAPQAGILGRVKDKDDVAANEELREERRRLDRMIERAVDETKPQARLDETETLVRVESEGGLNRGG